MTAALHQDNDLADSKLASGFFASAPRTRARLAAPQVTSTHLESAVFIYELAPECVVAPNKPENPDCAGLRQQRAITSKVLTDNGRNFASGGRYADQIGLLQGISGPSGASLVNTASGVALSYVGIRFAEAAATQPGYNPAIGLGRLGADFLATQAAIAGAVYDYGSAAIALRDGRTADAVQSGASGTLTTTALLIARSNPYTAVAAGAGQVVIGVGEIGANAYLNYRDERWRQEGAQTAAGIVSSASEKLNSIDAEMQEKGCK